MADSRELIFKSAPHLVLGSVPDYLSLCLVSSPVLAEHTLAVDLARGEGYSGRDCFMIQQEQSLGGSLWTCSLRVGFPAPPRESQKHVTRGGPWEPGVGQMLEDSHPTGRAQGGRDSPGGVSPSWELLLSQGSRQHTFGHCCGMLALSWRFTTQCHILKL